MISDITGDGYFEFDETGHKHKENVKTMDFAIEDFTVLPFWKKCFYRFLIWHYATKVLVVYNFIADCATLLVFGYYVMGQGIVTIFLIRKRVKFKGVVSAEKR
jgi:hypothetical protein